MKKSQIWTIAVVVLLCLNSIVLIVLWQQKKQLPPPPSMQGQQTKDFLITQLALNPQQIVKFDTLRHRHRRALDSLEGKIRGLKDSLFVNLKNAKADSLTVNKLADKIGYDEALANKVTYGHFKQLRTILNPAQQTKFDSIIEQVLHTLAHAGPPPPRGNGRGDMRPEPPQGAPGKPNAAHHPRGDRSEVKPDNNGDRPMGPPPGMDGMPPDGPPPGDMPPGPPPGGDKNHRRPPGNGDMPPGPPPHDQKPAQ